MSNLKRYSVKSDPLGDPFGGEPRRRRLNQRQYDPITAAIGVSAGSSLIGGMMSSDAASGAAKTQADAANRAADMTQAQFQQVRNDLAPYRALGTGAINPLLSAMGYGQSNAAPAETREQIYQRLLPQFTSQVAQQQPTFMAGNEDLPPIFREHMERQMAQAGGGGSSIDTAGLNAAIDAALAAQTSNQFSGMTQDPNSILHQQFSFNPGDLTKTPGYQFNFDQGMRAVNNSAGARGLGLSGAQLKGATSFVSGLADNTYQNQYNNALTQYQTNYNSAANNVNRLLGLVGVGQSAANQTGAFGSQATGNMGNYLTSGANAQAAGQIGGANAMAGSFNNIGNNALMYAMRPEANGGNSGGVTLYGMRS